MRLIVEGEQALLSELAKVVVIDLLLVGVLSLLCESEDTGYHAALFKDSFVVDTVEVVF